MANHDELVAEMPVLEQMGTQERQKLAKKRRMQQLKKWSQREKEWLIKEKQLNKRLANTLHEENNGLNLKQYTTYNSNQRNKKKLISNTNNRYTQNGNGKDKNEHVDKKFTNNNYTTTNNNNNNNNNNSASNGLERPSINSLAPNGRVHFNVGVMLLEAAARNDYDEVKRLLTLGVSPDSVNHDGLTALHQCCIDASEQIMNLLLEYGANVDARDTERWTPLHAACTCGHLNLVKILVEHDADLLAVNGDGNMPFDISEDEATLDYIESQMLARGITQEMIDLTRASSEMQMLSDLEKLVSEKCDPNPADSNGVTQLHIAAANNYLSVVKFLLKQGVDVNVCDNDLWQPLHGVACWGNEQHIKIVELLVESGANLNSKTSNDETVFDLCDNVDLLEKMNQLKDELETKQASGTGRLKRTQSKTNSRIHSVRRTSVRDKNQISRREAREEALLRVESSEALNTNSCNTNGDQPKPPPLTSESSDTQSDSSPSKSIDSLQQQQQQLPNNQTSFDQVDSIAPIETDLDQVNGQAQPMDEQNGSRQDNKNEIDLTRPDNADSPRDSTKRSQQEDQMFETTQVEQITSPSITLPESSQSSYSDTNGLSRSSNHQSVKTPDEPTVSPLISSSTKPTTDLNGRLPAQSTTIVQVHFAPMNYTLSNLKKHRSDLRMRGAGSFTSAHTTIVHLDGQTPSLQSDLPNGHPSSMPSMREAHSMDLDCNGLVAETQKSTFRKFHGEPSEAIEYAESRKNHKCCVII